MEDIMAINPGLAKVLAKTSEKESKDKTLSI